jgi:reactive intermediate/imine deaminase
MANVRFVNPPTLARPSGYTQVVEVTGGRMIFISGQVALDPEGNVVGEGDFRAQTEQVFENLAAALETVGGGFEHIVKMNHYLTDMSQLNVLRDVRARHLDVQNPPASTAVEITGLAHEKFLIEIEAVAVIPG